MINEEVANITSTTEPDIATLFNLLPFVLLLSPIVIWLGWILGERHPSHHTQKKYSYRNYIKTEKKYLRGFK